MFFGDIVENKVTEKIKGRTAEDIANEPLDTPAGNLFKHGIIEEEPVPRDKPRRRRYVDSLADKHISKNSRFNLDYVRAAERLIAAGFTDKDLSYVLGLGTNTITQWKRRHPNFRAACEKGKVIAKQHAIAQLHRAACGYHYNNKEVTYDDKGNVKTVKIKTLWQPPEPQLLQYLLNNISGGDFKNHRSIKLEEDRNINLIINGKCDEEAIKRHAGLLFGSDTDKSARKSIVSSEVSTPVS